MGNWEETTEESKKRWETNADFWDDKMGEESNSFHREIIRPDTEKLLAVKDGDLVLDIACGNGNFSKRLVEFGAEVVAFDYSEKMIENAKKRCEEYINHIDFQVVDATKYEHLLKLEKDREYDKAVSNMGIMDISDITGLLKSVYEMLKIGGVFVFSIMHPCFQAPKTRQIVETEDVGDKLIKRQGLQIFKYIKPESFEGIGIVNQPVSQIYYHRPLNVLLNDCFNAGFVISGLEEPVFKSELETSTEEWNSIPPVLIVRLSKV